jgi:coenzyme F420-reducing hydrogenase beta subunit
MKSYIVKQKDMRSRMQSRSGGIFAAVSDEVLRHDGIVYGCALDEEFRAVHRRAATKEERDAFRGSKYVQSTIGTTMQQVVSDLKAGKKVLFSGTPCQVAGLLAYCPEAEKENLLCMDIVCHGVPSPKVWQDYLSYMETKHHGRVSAVDFRNKRNHGWWDHVETLTIRGREYDSQTYMKLFYEHHILRECCYECPYKNLHRPGDITIADAWGIAKANPEFDDNYGVSLVLCNTKKGEIRLNEAFKTCDYLECDLEQYMQEPLIRSFSKPEDYEDFWDRYFHSTFSEMIKGKYEDSLKQKIRWKTKRMVKSVVPQRVINQIRGRKG